MEGNKSDLKGKREITMKEAEDWAKSLKASYFEVSAQSGENIEQCFQASIRTFTRGSPNPTTSKRRCIII